MSINQIIKGHVNEFLGREDELSELRTKICEQCPLYKVTFIKDWFGGICDSNKYLNPQTNQVSYFPGEGFVQGCSCRVNAKTRVLDAKCVAGKW